MTVRVVCVGRIQPMYKDIQTEFLKRLSRYCKAEVIEVADEQAPENLSEKQKQSVMSKEWERCEKKLSDGDFTVLLDSRGKKMTSESLSEALEHWHEVARKSVTFVLGGSLGLAEQAFMRADAVLSLSDMTFTHSMARIVLLEQVYRANKITAGEPYHK